MVQRRGDRRMKNSVTYRTDSPPQWMYTVRAMAGCIAELQRKSDPNCYLHIADWQRYRGLTLQSAADKIGVNVLSYRNWHDNRHWPNAKYMAQIAHAFQCSIEELYYPPPGMRQ